jgi:histidinol phosphatase-like enzyme (inositol monophosphatase family)
MSNWTEELNVAREAAKQAGQLALQYQHGIEAVIKDDLSPVTRADREAEQLITSIISKAFPDDGLLGEEGANRESRNGRRWIIDPIDGTRDYMRGNPLWATLIGLEVDSEITVGVASLPGLGAVYTASHQGGAFRNGEPIRASSISSLSEAVLCFNGFNRLDKTPFKQSLADWMGQCWAVRCLGGAPDALLVASGQAEIWIESAAAPWDLAPLKIIAEEAGASFFNFDGRRTVYGGASIICTPAIEAQVRTFLNDSQRSTARTM